MSSKIIDPFGRNSMRPSKPRYWHGQGGPGWISPMWSYFRGATFLQSEEFATLAVVGLLVLIVIGMLVLRPKKNNNWYLKSKKTIGQSSKSALKNGSTENSVDVLSTCSRNNST